MLGGGSIDDKPQYAVSSDGRFRIECYCRTFVRDFIDLDSKLGFVNEVVAFASEGPAMQRVHSLQMGNKPQNCLGRPGRRIFRRSLNGLRDSRARSQNLAFPKIIDYINNEEGRDRRARRVVASWRVVCKSANMAMLENPTHHHDQLCT